MTRIANCKLVRGRLLLLALLGSTTGCGGPGNGSVSGVVLLDGVPLPGGTVMFYSVASPTDRATAILDETGTFSVKSLPAGEVMVCVDNRNLEPKAPQPPPPRPIPKSLSPEMREKLHISNAAPAAPAPAAPTGPGKYVAIPAKYYLAETSDLKFTLPTGSMTHNIELKSK